MYGTQARYPCHLPSVLSHCQGQEINCHVERIILHYLYCQFYSISECIVSYSLTLTVVITLKRLVQLSFRCTVNVMTRTFGQKNHEQKIN